MNVYAQGVGSVIGTIAPGPFGNLNFSDIASWGVGLFFFFIGMVSFGMLLIGALNWISSGGEEKKLGEARNRITSAVIGLAIAVAVLIGWFFVVGPILGIFKNGQINIPTVQSVCKRDGASATSAAQCCSGLFNAVSQKCGP